MDCPKCGHQQADTIKCASCGIYFAKFAEQQARLASRPREGMQHAPPEAGFGWGAITLTAIVSVVLVWGLMRGRTPAGASGTRGVSSAAGSPRALGDGLLRARAQWSRSAARQDLS